MTKDILKIIKQYNLGRLFRYWLEYNSSQVAPYHNATHCLQVMLLARDCYIFETGKEAPRSLIIAALFHDFDHSKGFYNNDRLNTERAISGFWEYILNHQLEDKIDYTEQVCVEKLIAETTWPHGVIQHLSFDKEYNADFKIQVKCLRDADLLYWKNNVIDTLINIRTESFSNLNYAICINHSKDFLRTIKFNTKYAKQQGKLKEVIKQLEQLEQLCFYI